MAFVNLFNGSRNVWANMRVETLKVDSGLDLPDGSIQVNNLEAGNNGDVLTTVGGNVEWTSGGDNIYSNDGVLNGNRIVDGGTNDLSFNNLNDYTLDVGNDITTTCVGDWTLGANELNINSDVSITPTPATDNLVPQVLSIEPITNKLRMRDISTLSGSLERNITVAQSGGDYTDINSAVAAAIALTPVGGDTVNIYVYSGTYEITGTLTIPKFIKLVGIGNPTITRTAGAATDILILNDLIQGFRLTSSTNTGNFITFGGFGEIKDCLFACGNMANVVESDFGLFMNDVNFSNAAGANSAFGRFDGAGSDYTFNNVEFISLNAQAGFECISGRYNINNCVFRLDNLQPCLDIDTSREVLITSSDFRDGTSIDTGLDISNGDISLIGCNFINNLGTQLNISGGDVLTNACNLDETLITGLDLLKGSFQSTRQDEPSFKSLNELNVGTPTNPREAAIGGGDSYPIPSAKTCTAVNAADLGSGFNDITSTLARNDGSSASLFAATSANNCFLIGSDIATFSGIKIELSTALVLGAGVIVIEYYSSGSGQFEPVNVMSTTANGNFNSRANVLFELGEYQYRFNVDQTDMGLVSIDGLSAYYLRFRITTGITTAPQCDYVKVHPPGRCEINGDGFVEVFNDTTTRSKQLNISTSVPVGGSPADQDIYLSQTLRIGFRENRFVSTSDNFVSFIFPVPENCDTSKVFNIVLKFAGDDANLGDVIFSYEAAYFTTAVDNNGAVSEVYFVGVTAPLTAAGDLTGGAATETFSFGVSEDRETKNIKIPLDISSTIGRRRGVGSESSDLIALRLGRLGSDGGDTYPGNIVIIDQELEYIIWYI